MPDPHDVVAMIVIFPWRVWFQGPTYGVCLLVLSCLLNKDPAGACRVRAPVTGGSDLPGVTQLTGEDLGL